MNPTESSHADDLPFRRGTGWIWSREGTHAELPAGEGSPSHYQVRRFRRTWTMPVADVRQARIHVSADSRFILYCNGRLVGRGPAKVDVHHQFYDTFDLTAHLVAGRNVLAALVWDMSGVAHRPHQLGAPCSIITDAGGFVLEGTVAWVGGEEELDTGRSPWRVAIDRAHRFQNEGTRFEGYHGYFEERVDAELPPGWLAADFDDRAWEEATTLYRAERREDRRDPASPYGLLPRIIPQLTEGPAVPFRAGFLPGGGELPAAWQRCLAEPAAVVEIPPHTTIDLILDTGELTSGYPQLEVEGGAGACVRLTYAEALRLPWTTPEATLLGQPQPLANLASHFADEQTGWTFDRRGTIHGWSDVWRPAGGVAEFEPLHWRAFRFLGLSVRTGDAPLRIQRIAHRYSAYPYDVQALFACSDPRWERIWTAGLRTMRLCSHETFEDCPHYEQMQYAGDTMITSHLGLLTTGDARLSRQALLHFDWSRIPDGLTQSRYPSRLLQVIPSWSLHWITAVRDYGLASGDLALVAEVLPGMRAVVDWFRRHADEQGLPARLPYWNITDWCPWWPRGVVPGADTGPTCIISAQYIQALAELAEMCAWLGRSDEATTWQSEVERLRGVLHATFWSESEGLYFDRPGGPEVSQYGNAWAVACGAAPAEVCARLRDRFPDDPKLAPGSFFSWHTTFKAMRAMGTYARMPDYLGPWHESIDLGLDTFVEENSYWRSLCHAWSAHPVLEFLQQVLGVQAIAPGFARVRIAPQRCGLEWAQGRVCTPLGPIEVQWRQQQERFEIEVTTPAAMPAEIVLPDGSVRQSAGGRWSTAQEVPA